jgi:hypothetical protein
MFAGGIVTNTNHSAMYTRMGNRNATLGIDAVYYNPAGLTKLGNGFHFSLNNQVIGQSRMVTTDYNPILTYRDPKNNGEFEAEVTAPLFPGIYGVFKLGKWAFSAGFNPVGGGGSATYKTGLPSFEYPISDMPAALQLQGQNVTAYRLNSKFDGSSVFYGIQGNVSYAINDMISVALGARYVMVNEQYTGHIKDVAINADGTWTAIPTYFANAATYATQVASDATDAANALQLAIDMGAGGLPLDNQQLITALTAAGVYVSGMTNAQAQAAFQGIAATATSQAAVAQAQAEATSFLADPQYVDAEKTGNGIIPIVSVNLQPIDMLNIAVKYEHSAKLELTTAVAPDKRGVTGIEDDGQTPIYMFTDGEKTRIDMPALLTLGVTLRPVEKLLLAGGFNTFFEKDVVWGTEDVNRTTHLTGNSWELGLAAEYALGDKFLVSAGWLMTETGATPDYQTDQSYSLGSQGVNAGFAWDILPLLQLNVGGQYVKYIDDENKFDHDLAGLGMSIIPVTEKLQKTSWVVGVGLNITLASKGD